MKRRPPDYPVRCRRLQLRREDRERVRLVRRKAKRLKRQYAMDARRSHAYSKGLFLDRDLTREQIVLPATFSFQTNHEETAGILERMRDCALRDGRSLMLHFEHLQHIEPAAALALVAEIHRIRNLRGFHGVTGTYPTRRVIYELLREMGFYNILSISERSDVPELEADPARPIFLKFMTGNRVEAKVVDDFVTVLEEHIFTMNALARGRLVAAIIEAMTNTLNHAHPARGRGETMRNRWWMSSWMNMEDGDVTVMLFDQGVGIPATLDPTLYERIRSALTDIIRLRSISAQPTDGEMIVAATELHRTGTGQSGRGKGFRDMKMFVDVCADGELRVLSNRGRYRYSGGTEEYADASNSIGGTVIEWRFRHNGSVELHDV